MRHAYESSVLEIQASLYWSISLVSAGQGKLTLSLLHVRLPSLCAATLVQNYRSHSTLLDIPNNLFYHGSLVASADQAELQPPAWAELDSDATRKPGARKVAIRIFKI